MNAHELNQRLTDQLEATLRHLFPNGKKVRGEFCVGGLDGAAGDSLKVHLGGAKKGYWCDFADDGKKGRSVLGLWIESQCGGDKAKGCSEAKKWLGINDDYTSRFLSGMKSAPRKEPEKLDRSKMRGLVPNGAAYKYLTEERCIEPGALPMYRIAESASGDAIVFPFYATEETPDGAKLAETAYMAKFLKLERAGGKKEIWTQPGGVTDSLFGKRADLAAGVPKDMLVITEGEIDALSVASYGWHGVSVPRGAKAGTADGKSANDQWIDADFAWLADYERIYLWMDNDAPGQAAAADIARRIGLERCFLITTPRGLKDANECLCNGVPSEEIAEAMDKAVTLDPANLQWASEFEEKVLRRLFPPGGVEPGFDLPWPFPWKIRPNEATVWTGFSKHGKTVALSHLMVHLAGLGERVCVASMEVEPDKTLETLWCQANGARMPWDWEEGQNWDDAERLRIGEERFRARYRWLAERFLIFLPQTDASGVGRADWRVMLDCFIYARQRYGCTQFVVDSLMMCVGRSEGEYHEVELFINALSNFAKRHGVHVHIVAHSRKKEDENKPPGKQDIAGPKETADVAHNVVVVHRNMKKATQWQKLEREREQLAAVQSGSPEAIEERDREIASVDKELSVVKMWHDGELHLLGQRNGDGETGSKYLYFLKNCRQFVQGNPYSGTRTPDSRPSRYITAGSELPSTEELKG